MDDPNWILTKLCIKDQVVLPSLSFVNTPFFILFCLFLERLEL
jgi:hypothetical protein